MEKGYIKITDGKLGQSIVEAKLVSGTLWLTKYEIADLFNVSVISIGNSFRAIFKSGTLREEKVTRMHKYENKHRQCEVMLYNLEAIIFVSYRVASLEARAFREWVMEALTEYTKAKPPKETEVLIVYNLASKLHAITAN